MTASSRLRARGYLAPAVALLVLIAFFVLTVPGFSGQAATFSVLDGFSLLGIIAVGVSVTILVGELDLAAASVAAVSGILAVMMGSAGLLVTIVVVTLLGALFGLVQGVVITRTGINSLVFTVGTLLLLRGVAFVISGEQSTLLQDLSVSDPLITRWGVISPTILVGLGVLIAVQLWLGFHRSGRAVYAVGGARAEARSAGVSVNRAVVSAFIVSGACAALAGSLAALKAGGATPSAFGDLLLASVAAVLVGGVALSGGRGTMANVALGVAIVSTVSAGMAARGSTSSEIQLVTGALLLGIVGLGAFGSRLLPALRTATRRTTPQAIQEPAA
jgi:ribose transport system permease protein